MEEHKRAVFNGFVLLDHIRELLKTVSIRVSLHFAQI